jgi:putative flippase GtrA
VTSLSLLRRPAVAAAGLDELDRGLRTALRRAGRGVVRRLSGDEALAQFGRFVLVGGISSLLYALLFVLFDGVGDLPANAIGSIASSALANEMHRRLTFRADGRISWFTAQWEGGGLTIVGMVATSLALAGVDALLGDVTVLWELVLVGVVTGGIGLVRFAALRWLFAARADAV